jgi:hypothetical protein
MPEKSDLQKGIEYITSWGRQTIAYAMSLKDERSGKKIDDPAAVTATNKEARVIAKGLWDSAFKECGQTVQPLKLMMTFAAKVFEWVKNHLAS